MRRNTRLYNSGRWAYARNSNRNEEYIYCGAKCVVYPLPCIFRISKDGHIVDFQSGEKINNDDEMTITIQRYHKCKCSVKKIMKALYTKDAIPVVLGEPADMGEW